MPLDLKEIILFQYTFTKVNCQTYLIINLLISFITETMLLFSLMYCYHLITFRLKILVLCYTHLYLPHSEICSFDFLNFLCDLF